MYPLTLKPRAPPETPPPHPPLTLPQEIIEKICEELEFDNWFPDRRCQKAMLVNKQFYAGCVQQLFRRVLWYASPIFDETIRDNKRQFDWITQCPVRCRSVREIDFSQLQVYDYDFELYDDEGKDLLMWFIERVEKLTALKKVDLKTPSFSVLWWRVVLGRLPETVTKLVLEGNLSNPTVLEDDNLSPESVKDPVNTALARFRYRCRNLTLELYNIPDGYPDLDLSFLSDMPNLEEFIIVEDFWTSELANGPTLKFASETWPAKLEVLRLENSYMEPTKLVSFIKANLRSLKQVRFGNMTLDLAENESTTWADVMLALLQCENLRSVVLKRLNYPPDTVARHWDTINGNHKFLSYYTKTTGSRGEEQYSRGLKTPYWEDSHALSDLLRHIYRKRGDFLSDETESTAPGWCNGGPTCNCRHWPIPIHPGAIHLAKLVPLRAIRSGLAKFGDLIDEKSQVERNSLGTCEHGEVTEVYGGMHNIDGTWCAAQN